LQLILCNELILSDLPRFAFVGIFTNKSDCILLVKTPTKAKTSVIGRSLSFQGAKLLGKIQINKAVFGFLLYILQKRCDFVGLVQELGKLGIG
jgi:hypothetical protein